jgi:hypothetical protein
MHVDDDYFAGYHSLKLTRDAEGGASASALVKSMRAQNEKNAT